MVILLAFLLWLTIAGANYPSRLLADFLFRIQDLLTEIFAACHAPEWLHGILVLGVYRVVAWVVSVMLPPMAIFFPLFTLLEDSGYLPRIAYNLDRPFQCCHACGKQALTMCMVFSGLLFKKGLRICSVSFNILYIDKFIFTIFFRIRRQKMPGSGH